jgi:hypothetical protein
VGDSGKLEECGCTCGPELLVEIWVVLLKPFLALLDCAAELAVLLALP